MDIKDYKVLLKSSELKDAIRAERVCIFLGAGVANNLNMPNWDGIAWKMIDYCTKNNIFKHSLEHTLSNVNDPLKQISYCIEKVEKNNKTVDLKKKLQKIFIENPSKMYKNEKPSIYRNLIKLCETKRALIVQTNYDDIIETNVKRDIKSIIPYDSPPIKLTNDYIVYLHGKCVKGDYENWVFNRQQYNDVYVLEKSPKFERQKMFLRNLLTNYHIIFLGYSLQDVEILQLIANKQEVETYKKIEVIIDTCEAKKFINEVNANYWGQYSQGNISVYSYKTERGGISQNFAKVVKDLTKVLCSKLDTEDILKFIDPTRIKKD